MIKALWLAFLFIATLGQTAITADEVHTDRIKIQYEFPTNPEHLRIYDLLRGRNALEKLQKIFAPFRLPLNLTIRTTSCGEDNAWYERSQEIPVITICYEYIDEIKLPTRKTSLGITPTDALVGQFFYVAAHEIGHAVFDLLEIPILGHPEDAADQFAAYVMLQFGKGQSRALIGGAAFAYRDAILEDKITVPLRAFSSSHGRPQARFFDLVCLAYGSDPRSFADLIDKGYLPESRGNRCKKEFYELAFAFEHLILPHVDEEMKNDVIETEWLARECTKQVEH